jgi:DNA-binding GntR family transcriptional regulator
MYTDRHTAGEAVLAGASRGDHAYAELKRRLLAGEFGLNVRLGEERLAALTGVSRTPVREALMRLHAEGLVDRWADGGFRPVAPDVDLMRQSYTVRSLLEVAALHLPGRTGSVHDPGGLDLMQREWGELRDEGTHDPDPGFVLLDESFHLSLAEAAGNQVLVEVLRQLNDRIRLVRTQDFLVPGRIDATIDEHLAILDAVRRGDVRAAHDLLELHIGTSEAVVGERVAQAIARMAREGGEP